MLCYKDMTFCSAKCLTIQCPRNKYNLDPKHVAAVGLPIAERDFSSDCGSYAKDEKQ